jgi:hypothetical protein
MPLFKKSDGPGKIRITFCGYKKDVSLGEYSITLPTSANDANSARSILFEALKGDTIKDATNNSVNNSDGYYISTATSKLYTKGYAFTESKSNPGTYYHDFMLVNAKYDSQCSSGGRKRRTRNTKGKSKRNKKSRKTRRNRKY